MSPDWTSTNVILSPFTNDSGVSRTLLARKSIQTTLCHGHECHPGVRVAASGDWGAVVDLRIRPHWWRRIKKLVERSATSFRIRIVTAFLLSPTVVFPHLNHRCENVIPRFLLHHNGIREHATVPANVFNLLCDLTFVVAQPIA